MARRPSPPVGKIDRPGDVGRPAPQFAVHEIGEAAEEQAERHAAGDVIVDPEPVEPVLPRHLEDAEAGADHAAVERHAAVPQAQDLRPDRRDSKSGL